MPEPHHPPDVSKKTAPVTLQIVSIVIFTFLCYLNIGIPLAVIPSYVHGNLAYSSVIAGLVISAQYFGTLATRQLAGRMADSVGAKKTVQRGLISGAISGVMLIAAAWLHATPIASLTLLCASRLVLGHSESYASTGTIMWNIGRVGAQHSAAVISWNGVATYGALAIGAPLGVLMTQYFGFVSLGITVVVLSLLGLVLAWPKADAPVIHGERLPFFSVFSRVLPYGINLALGTSGFGALATFVTLYYASKNWPHAALALTVFGTLFVGGRLLFANSIKTLGGFRVAIVSFLVEAVGLALLWQAAVPQVALLGAALTGLGFALVFPALGVEAVALVPPASRGAALSTYAVFLDVSLGVTGPIAGLIAGGFGYGAVYLAAAIASVVAAILTLTMANRAGGGVSRQVV